MEISYVVLFGNFFYHSYIAGGGKKFNKEKQTPKTNGTAAATNGTMANGAATKSE